MTNFLRSLGWQAGLAVAAFGLFGVADAQAEALPNGGQLKANVTYTFEDINTDISCEFIPEKSGKITYNCGGFMHPYADADHTSLITGSWAGYSNGSLAYSMTVTAGVPIYFFGPEDEVSNNAYVGMIFKIVQDEPIDVVSYSPEPGTVLTVTDGYGQVDLTMNQPVKAYSAMLSVAGSDKTATLEVGTEYSMFIGVKYIDGILKLVEDGVIKGGEELTVSIMYIENENGAYYKNGAPLEIKYIAPNPPVFVTNVVLPDPFMAYWRRDAAGSSLVATYNAGISKASYELFYGNNEPESSDKYTETGSSDDPDSLAKVTIENNIVKVNFSGVKRTPADMLTSGTLYDTMTISLYAWDMDGNPIFSNQNAVIGRNVYNVRYMDDFETIVEEAISETGVQKIFSIDGRMINSDVKSLNKGLYIINGKKVIIK